VAPAGAARSFRVPFGRVVAPLSILSCLFLMLGLPLRTGAFVLLIIGRDLLVCRNSRLPRIPSGA
jgi:hypothetical protein